MPRNCTRRARFAKRAAGRARRLCEGIAGHLPMMALRLPAHFGISQNDRALAQTHSERGRQAWRGLRAISGQSHAKRRLAHRGLFCQGQSHASISRTRVLVLKSMQCAALHRLAGPATRGASAGLAGSAVHVILQDCPGSVECGINRGHPRNRRRSMPKPHARVTCAISPGHLPMMVRLLARIQPERSSLAQHTRRPGAARAASVDRDRQDPPPRYRFSA